MNKDEVYWQILQQEFKLAMLEKDPERNKKEISDIENRKPVLAELWELSD